MLISRNVTIGDLRTSMRLEPEFWIALGDIARIESLTLDALCSRVDAHRGALSRTAAMRLFATAYFNARRESGAAALEALIAASRDIPSDVKKRR
jgi:predicted DNA-binding ribbon-helix-helix protein